MNARNTPHDRSRPTAGGLRARLASLGRDEDGAIAVEWSLVAMFIGFLMLGAFNFGTAALHKMEMANAVRSGLQYAVVRKPIQGDTSQISTTVLNAAPTDKTGTRALTVTMFSQCPDGSSVANGGNCSVGEPMAFVSIELQEDYDTIIKLPFTKQRLTFKTSGTVRLN